MAPTAQIGRQRNSCRFSSVLSSAVFEWLLMLLLFLNALFSYLVTKFARFCKLQIPCLLCSRLDHILGNEKPGFYKDLICNSHKSEISSLAYCHVHQKLADIHEMCEGCLHSFATEKKCNSETYRSLVGKLGLDLDNSVDGDGLQNTLHGEDVAEVPLLNKDLVSGSVVTRYCSCCSEPCRNKLHAVRLLQNKPIKVDVSEVGISLPNSTGHSRLHHQDGLIKTVERSLGSTSIYYSGNHGSDRLSHIGYSEVKVTSDSESEVPFSDDDNGNAVVHGAEDLKEDLVDRCLQPEPATIIPNSFLTTLSDDTPLEKLIHPAPIVLESSLSIPGKQLLHVGVSHDVSSLASTVAIGHGLEEINWNKIEARTNPSAPSEAISQKVPSEVSNAKYVSENCDVACISTTFSEEASKALSSTEVNLKTSQITSDPGLSVPIQMDLNDAYKLAIGNKGSLASPTVTEVIAGRDSSRVYEDLKLLISQISSSRGLENPWNDMSPSPRVHGQGDDFRFSDASSSAVLQNITKRLSIDRNESGLESLDGSIVSEIEGESAADRLKRQVELDRKSMYLLYKELEEERSASAIAANQTMAMITRLQEEKAAMQMEALQYQRMMEEQAEYDQEALQKSNELLAQREKEIQDLEAVVESYRKRFGDELLAGNVVEPSGDSQAPKNSLTGTALDKKSGFSNKFEQTESGISKVPLLGFEDEKTYISDCLKKLEKKLYLFSNNGVYVDMSRLDVEEHEHLDKPYTVDNGENSEQGNGQYSEVAAGSNDSEHPNVSQENSQMEEELLSEKDSSLYREDSNAKTSSSLSTEGTLKENHKENILSFTSNNDSLYLSTVGKASNLAALGNEVSHLNERLEALEADRNFLEHTINSLRNGDGGVQFIQEIACHLRELRRIGITRRENTVA